MASIDYQSAIPNNVDLDNDRRLQRALERWQPAFLDWWKDMGPEGYQAKDVYLRTAVSTEPGGWAVFDHVKMPDYRWGIFLADREKDRVIPGGDHAGKPVWQEVPGEHRNALRRIIVTQGDTEPASVEQQRLLAQTAPSLMDMRNLFQVNVEEGLTSGRWSTCFTPTLGGTDVMMPRNSWPAVPETKTSPGSWMHSTSRAATG